MASIVNKYHFSAPTTFIGVEKIPNTSSFFVIGTAGTKGFYGVIESNGTIKWARTLEVQGRTVGMVNVVAISGGDFLVYGTYVVGTNRQHHLVFRVKPDGQIVWQREVNSLKTRFAIRLLQNNNNVNLSSKRFNYTLIGWHNKKGSVDSFEFKHLSIDGTFASFPQSIGDANPAADNQITTAVIYDFKLASTEETDNSIKGLALGGGTTFLGGYIPYFVLGDETLQGRYNFVIRTLDEKNNGQIDGLLYDSVAERLIVGFNRWSPSEPDKSANSIVLTTIDHAALVNGGINQPGSVFEFKLSNREERIKKIMRHGNSFYAAVNAVDGSLCAVIRFELSENGSISLTDGKKLAFDTNAVITDLISVSADQLGITGYCLNKENKPEDGFFVLCDNKINSCISQNLSISASKQPELKIELIDPEKLYQPKGEDTLWTETDPEFIYGEQNTSPESLCPVHEFELEGANLIQSPYLNLQAAGSVGQDSSMGIHLRWFLLNALGDRHLPKGDYATNTSNFNRPNDYVFLYRWPYSPQLVTINFANKPKYIDDYRKIWTYQVSNKLFYLYFHDKNKYNTVKSTVSPVTNPHTFLAHYHPAPLELRLRDDLFFAGSVTVSGAQTYTLFLETHSVDENTATAQRVISSSSKFTETSGGIRFKEENIRSLYFSLSSGNINSISVETYTDAIHTVVRKKNMQFIGQFALTKDTNEAYKRLEDQPRFKIDGSWKKFNDGAFVKTQNYRNRWYDTGSPMSGLSHGVETYISLSDDPANPLAVGTFTPDFPDTDTPAVEHSYLDLLQIVSADFHNARMLGLGYVDTPSPFITGEAQGEIKDTEDRTPMPATYLYLIEYITEADMATGESGPRLQHLYLSLPTSIQDERLPLPLEINQLTYGLYAQHNTSSPILLTDSNGYTPDGTSRYINVFTRLPYDFSKYPGLLPAQKQFFSFEKFSLPVFGGIEYKKQGVINWVTPEIAHEENYSDTNGKGETTPLILQDNKPTLIHREQEEGIHEYAPYAINIFSRASQLGTPVPTDLTHFVRRNSLLPPSEFFVQLIQRENPLMLTTLSEQDMLTNIATQDKTLVRVTFNYHHVHDRAYDFGDAVRLYFREQMPRAVIGGVESIHDIGGLEQDIQATDFYYASTDETKVPDIPTALRPNFLGSALAVDGRLYFVQDINYDTSDTSRPVFRIRKNEERMAQTSGGQATLSQQFLGLNTTNDVNKPFMLVENMAQPANWGAQNPLSFEIKIGSTQWITKTDGHRNTAGDWTPYDLRGIWAQANLTVLQAANGNGNYYRLQFPGFKLENHPQFNDSNPVQWHKGVVRIAFKNNPDQEKKVLNVAAIYNIGHATNDLELDVTDDAYNSADFDLNNLVEVNFYPGYKAYLYSEPLKDFDESHILPATGEGYRNTLMGASSKDSGNNYQSQIGVPAILMAQEIVEPLVPGLPDGPMYATEPNWYNKATYTFSTQLLHTPYAIIFYRADLNAVLHALYKPETVQAIKLALPQPPDDLWFTSRWKDLLALPSGAFTEFPTGNGVYRFPQPDKSTAFDISVNNDAVENMRSAIYSSFLPLTKTPVLYKDIQFNAKITPEQPAVITGNKVRFTDFTIDGSMITSYFYCAREMGNRMDFSAHSPIAGPVQLINTTPPPAPVIRKMTTRLNDAYNGTTSAITFQVNTFLPIDRITKIRIFRADTAVDALSVQSMKMVKEIDLNSLVPVDSLYTIEDEFFDLPEVPYGDPQFYRIVSTREVPCQDVWGYNQIKYVPSYPTKVFLANVVDTINPEPPEISIDSTVVGSDFTAVHLEWQKTTYKGKYHLFKMTSAGQWSKLLTFENAMNDQVISVNLADTSWGSDILPSLNDDGDKIYHRFKVSVESTSGLLNLYDKILTTGEI